MQDQFDHIRLILRKDYSRLQKQGNFIESESEESKTGLSSEGAQTEASRLSKGQKLFWIDIKDLTNMTNKRMDVDSQSDDLNLTRQQSSFVIDEDIQRNLFQILQSEVNSLANSEEEDIEETLEIPVVNSDDYSHRSSDEECTSSCDFPCANERHQETMILLDIVNKAFEENDFASKSEEGVLKSIFQQKAPKSKFSMFMKASKDCLKPETNPEEAKKVRTTGKLDVNKWFVPQAVAIKEAKIQQTTYFDLEAIAIEGYKFKQPIVGRCILIEDINNLDLLDELKNLNSTDMIGLNVQMNADVLNDLYRIDVFGPSILTIGTVHKVFIVDIMKLGRNKELDLKLTDIFKNSQATFCGFGIPTLINYFQQFYREYNFLKNVERIIDARIMYHKVQKKGQRSFASIFYILFAKRIDMTVQFSDWEQRPLTQNQLHQTGIDLQNLLRIVFKLKGLGENKNKINLRVYLDQIVSYISNFTYVDNPAVQNQFQKHDLRVKKVPTNWQQWIYYKEERKIKQKHQMEAKRGAHIQEREARKFMKMIMKKQKSEAEAKQTFVSNQLIMQLQKRQSEKPELKLNFDNLAGATIGVDESFEPKASLTTRNQDKSFFTFKNQGSPKSDDNSAEHARTGQFKYKDDSAINVGAKKSTLPTLSKAQKEILSEFEEKCIRQAVAEQKRKIMEEMRMVPQMTPQPPPMVPMQPIPIHLQQMIGFARMTQAESQTYYPQERILLEAKPFYPSAYKQGSQEDLAEKIKYGIISARQGQKRKKKKLITIGQ